MKSKAKIWVPILSVVVLLVVAVALYGYVYPERIPFLASQEDTDAQGESQQDVEEIAEDANSAETIEDSEKEIESSAELIFTGDVLLSDYVLANYDASGIDGVVSEDLRTQLEDADVLEINHEFPFSTRGTQAEDKQYTFRVDPVYVSILQEMGVDAAGLANNHVLDYGQDALLDTFTTLTDAGIDYTGAGTDREDASKLLTYEINGETYGILAASRVIPVASWNVDNAQPGVFCTYDTTQLVAAIQEAKESCDYVFVCVHWGVEHTSELTDYQTAMAHAFIDAGASAVIGAHPHVLQGIEYYNGAPIFYSLGNFIFNQTIDSTAAVRFVVEDGEMTVQLIPATASGAKTSLATEEKANAIYSYLEGLSSTITIDDQGIVTEN